MTAELACSITKTASKQTYYTVRFLADRDRVDDAYRSYAYFRWVDDILDSDSEPESARKDGGASERRKFLERQKNLLESCFRGEPPRDASIQERMLIELIDHDREKNSGLQTYLRNMMRVMDFDARRRGSLISRAELDEYTRWLAVAVAENMQYFIGHGAFAPRDETRYHAVYAAHVTHMLRDTFDDVRAGYFNIPREVLEAGRIGPQDVQSSAYRDWVRSRIRIAREFFAAGKTFYRRVANWRLRLAGFAYIARFEWLLDTMEKEGFVLRPEYPERKSAGRGLRMIGAALASLTGLRGRGTVSTIGPQREEKA